MPDDWEDTDHDALQWGGDDVQAPTSLPGRHTGARPAPAPSRSTARVAGDRRDDTTSDDERDGTLVPGDVVTDPDGDEDRQLGGATLVALGLLGGVYALLTVGWLVGAFRLESRSAVFPSDPMFLGAMWLVVLAPAAWFVTTWTLTRERHTWLRLVGLIAGVIVLVPWPFLATGPVTL